MKDPKRLAAEDWPDDVFDLEELRPTIYNLVAAELNLRQARQLLLNLISPQKHCEPTEPVAHLFEQYKEQLVNATPLAVEMDGAIFTVWFDPNGEYGIGWTVETTRHI